VNIIDGKKISDDIKNEIKAEIAEFSKSNRPPCLAVILAGNDPASAVYVRNKRKACRYVGITSVVHELPYSVSQNELLPLIERLNRDGSVDGILVQLPLPKHIDERAVVLAVNREKDVDGFNPYNAGELYMSESVFPPCTPMGLIELLKRSGIPIEGKHAVVAGRSNIAGKPAAMLLLRENATVTVCHSKTRNLAAVTKTADIFVAAIGRQRFFTADYIKEGAVVLDVGIHRDENGGLCGDVDFESCREKAGAITPTPGGTGAVTIAMLMRNCLEGYKRYALKKQ
jgi:methylenetetrahydrofolate dehydrogenase (NADP+)/methenyltetrahydrofolate cyclohydrolase